MVAPVRISAILHPLPITKVNARMIRGGLAQINDGFPSAPNRQLACAMNRLNKAIDEHIQAAKLAA